MDNKVSVVIPTFNRAKYLPFTIDSCLNQTIDCEIIVSDHGSTDETPELMKKYGDRISYIRKEKDFGPHFCWLEGVLNATHDLIHIQYDDDWILPTFIEECLSVWSDDMAFVFTKSQTFVENEGTYLDMYSNFGTKKVLDAKQISSFIVAGNVMNPACAIFRKKDIIDNIFLYHIPLARVDYNGVGSDVLFSLMASLRYKKVGFVDQYLAVFRTHEGSITASSYKIKANKIRKDEAYAEAHKLYLLARFDKAFNIRGILHKLYILLFLNKLNYFNKLLFYGYRIVFLKQNYPK